MKLRHLSVSFALLACAALSLPAPSSADEVKWPRRLVISVPASGNVVHMIVTALGKTIEEHTPVERVIVQPIGGPASWLPRMEKGQVDMAVHSGPDTIELIQGLGDGEKLGAKPFLRTVVTGSRNLYGVFTVPARNISCYSDLRNKVVVLRDPGNPLWERLSLIVLNSAGLARGDLKGALTMINYREVSTDILEGRTDALINPASGPFMMELAQSAGKNVYVEPSEKEAAYLMEHLRHWHTSCQVKPYCWHYRPAPLLTTRKMLLLNFAVPKFHNSTYSQARTYNQHIRLVPLFHTTKMPFHNHYRRNISRPNDTYFRHFRLLLLF